MFRMATNPNFNNDEEQTLVPQSMQRSLSNGSLSRLSRSGTLQTHDSRNNCSNGPEMGDDEDDEVMALFRSKSSIALPIRSLSPFRDACPKTNSLFDDSTGDSRSSTPELVMEQKDDDKEDDDDVELGKDLFQLQFRKSLLKALSSFSEAAEKKGSLMAIKEVEVPAEETEAELPKAAKKSIPKKPKTRKRKAKYPEEDLADQKLLKKDISETPIKRNMITRSSAAKCMKDSSEHSTYFNMSQPKTYIFQAAEEGNLEAVMELLPHTGPSVKRGRRRQSLLHVSAAKGQSDVVMHLLNLISPNTVNKDGQTPAHLAAMNGHTHILKIMFADKEFDPDVKDNWERTFRDMLVAPLFESSLLGNKQRIEVLLELGANPDYHAGKLVEGILSRELKVTTARQLAAAIYGDPFTRVYSKERKDYVNNVKVTFTRQPKTNSKKLNSLQPNMPAMLLV